ncbi:MAG: glycosyltransferase [Acidobacteriota bacterium]
MKILLVAGRYPWPARRGDQLRAEQLLRLLGEEHEVQLLAPQPSGPAVAPPSGVQVELYRRRRRSQVRGLLRALRSGMPLQAGLFFQADLGRRLRRWAPRVDLVVLLLARQVLHLPDLGDRPMVSDLIDSLSLNFEHRARVDHPWMRPLLRWEAQRLLRAEGRLVERAGNAWLVCERDRRALAQRLSGDSGELAVVPILVPPAPVTPATGADQETLVFTGNLGYFVNADAIQWFVESVWRGWAEKRPRARLVVAGSRPPRALRRLLRATRGAELVESPPDLQPILAQARVAIAPMRCGSGVPIKVLEAWRAGVPVIASSWAAAGTRGQGGRELLVADSVAEWHDALDELMQGPALAAQLVAAGRACLEREYSPEAVRAALQRSLAAASS